MTLLSWSTQYLIGNPVIDSEHEELFRLINTFHDHWQEKHDPQEIARVLNQLVSYTQLHFQHEEDIMQKAGYTALPEHMQAHETMVETIFRLRQLFEEKSIHLEMDAIKFAKSWLLDHILENDYRFRDFLARHKNINA